MDKLILSGLEFFGRHGCRPDERAHAQKFRVQVEVALEVYEAAQTDDLTRTVSWEPLYYEIKAILEGPSCNLVETVAERIAQKMLSHKQVQQVMVRVDKTDPPFPGPVEAVGVEILRRKGQ